MSGLRSDHDSLLLHVLQKEENISSFLSTIFDFLYRRTDFFRIMHSDWDKAGFKPGVAEQILLKEFKTYQAKAEDDEMRNHTPTHKIPDVGRITEISSDTECEKSHGDHSLIPDSKEPSSAANKALECYNGAVRDSYSWSQTGSELEVRVPVPEHVTKGKQVNCVIKNKSLSVSVEECGSSDNTWVDLVDGELQWEVNASESMWTLDPTTHTVLLTLEKRCERMWEQVLRGEEKIELARVENVKDLHELEEEAQMKIQQLMYDERQRKQGRPTSEQQKVYKMMEEAWDAEGSPFKGQPFDPTLLNVSGNTVTVNQPGTAAPAQPPDQTTSRIEDDHS